MKGRNLFDTRLRLLTDSAHRELKMASQLYNSIVGGHERVKIGTGDEMRKVERDIMVPKVMKERSMEICNEYVEGLSCNYDINYI